jgi:AraC family transcriptional regulator
MYGIGKLRRPTMYQRQWFESGGLAIDKYRRAAGEGAHYLDYHRIFVSLTGQARSVVDLDGRRLFETAIPKYFSAFEPAKSRVTWFGSASKCLNIYQRPEIYDNLINETELGSVELKFQLISNDDTFFRLILATVSELENDDAPDRLLMDCLSNTLAARIIQRARSDGDIKRDRAIDASDESIRLVFEYVNDNIGTSNLSLEELANVAGLSRFHFIRIFRRVAGITPHQYVMKHRVLRARELLLNSKLSLAEVARVAGFGSTSHFSRYFQKITGMTPSEFRQRR